MMFVVAVAISMLMAWGCSRIASSKGYESETWGAAGFLFWPVALPMLLLKGRNPKLFRRCADCGSTDVPFDVPVCRHCGRDERKHPDVGSAS